MTWNYYYLYVWLNCIAEYRKESSKMLPTINKIAGCSMIHTNQLFSYVSVEVILKCKTIKAAFVIGTKWSNIMETKFRKGQDRYKGL